MKRILTTLSIALVVLIAACKKDTYVEIKGVCPIVESTNPDKGATNVPLNQTITANFNEVMDGSTFTTTSFTLTGSAAVAGTVTYSGTTASFNPLSNLAANTTYIAKIKAVVKDLKGNYLQTDFIWTFSTGSTLSPVVIETDPANNRTGVYLNKTITATFSLPMNPSTINATTFTVTKDGVAVPGAVTYSGTTAYFTPTSNLTPLTNYVATIKTGAKTTAGTPLQRNYVWYFTTGITVAPYVIATDPANGSSSVLLNKVVGATFSEAMDPSTLNTSNFTVRIGTAIVLGSVSYTGTTAYFTPFSNLVSGTTYTATITTGAKNASGFPIANDYVWTFSTIPHLGPLEVDLATAAQFGILASSSINNLFGPSEVRDMNVGISPGVRSSIIGFPPAFVTNGSIYASNDASPVPAMLSQAKQDLTNAYLFAQSATTPTTSSVTGDLGNVTLIPGIYNSNSNLVIQNGNLTLDALGDVNAVWIFQVATDVATFSGTGGDIVLTNGAQAKNIFWQIGGNAILGSSTSFKGTMMVLNNITLNSQAAVTGRLLSRNGSVTLSNTNIINKP